jgi:valyl-tRNA synthetase
MQRFYPTSVMETGYDILFFWVARMVMMGLWFTEQAPFHTIYLHGLIRDKYGRKISKTLGNTIDPLDLVNQYGADPLRYTLITSGTPGNDVNMDTDRVEANWKFVNKIWQMANLITQNLDDVPLPAGLPAPSELDLPAQWIVSRAMNLTASVQRLFDGYQYGEAGRQLQEFLWHEFADWYLEIAKHALYQGDEQVKTMTRRVLVNVFDRALRLLHPFMPFVTEEIWKYLPHKGQALMLAQWTQSDAAYINDVAETEMNVLIDMVRGIREVRMTYNVEPGRKITALVSAGSRRAAIEQHSYLFARLCNVSEVSLLAGGEPENAASVVVSDVTVYLPLAGLVDVAAECERLNKEQAKLQEQIGRLQAQLGNEQFVTRAKPEIVERERAKLADLQASAKQIGERVAALCK